MGEPERLRAVADAVILGIFTRSFGKRWYGRLLEDDGVWETRDGRRLEIRLMSREHAENTVYWLRRHAWHLHTACWQWMERGGGWIPEVGQELALGPERWLERTPVMRALRRRAGMEG